MRIINKNQLPGVFLRHMKNTENSTTVRMVLPDIVKIPMRQHMGRECDPLIKIKDKIFVGQMIGETDNPFSVPVHSGVSGEVLSFENISLFDGSIIKCAVIKTDGLQTVCEGIKPPSPKNKDEFIKDVYRSGIAGLGGAGFPTHIKLNYKENPSGQTVDTLIINGAECEPYITSDNREMLENSDDIIGGIELVCEFLNISRAIIGIEDNKKEALSLFKSKLNNKKNINLVALKSRYPGGAEKILIYKSTGRTVKQGQIPADAGVVVLNVTTAASIHRYFKTGMPLVSRRVTVDGDAIRNPANVEVLTGTIMRDLVDFCGGFSSEPKKVLSGGPMMGLPVYDLNMPLTKTNNALLAFSNGFIKRNEHKITACIRCSRCYRTCPVNLMPRALESAYDRKSAAELNELCVSLCINCGCCSYVCPAKRELAYKNQLAKTFLRETQLKK